MPNDSRTRDLHVESIRPLVPPATLLRDLPLPEKGGRAIGAWRAEVTEILDAQDDRLLVVVGPCSIHDPAAAVEYATRLRLLADGLASDLRIVMRVYFEKPRTTLGWKGLINDPHLDGSYQINEGLHVARRLLLDVIARGLRPDANSWTPSRPSSPPTS